MRITLTDEEIIRLAHIMDHFTDYMYHDDRPDHGFGVLKQYRYLPDEKRTLIAFLAGKLMRASRKIQTKKYNEYKSESVREDREHPTGQVSEDKEGS